MSLSERQSATDTLAMLSEKLAPLVNGGANACLKGTPMIPLHRNTVVAIYNYLKDAAEGERGPPKAICGYPLPGWRLDHVQWDERQGQPDGWIVALKRASPAFERRNYVVMARSDLGPLEAWDEALQIAVREDAREAERAASADRNPKGEKPQALSAEHESAVPKADAQRPPQ